MSGFELAQMNVAVMKAPLDSPVMTDFVANLDRINALAEQSTGFVWRLQSDEGDATVLNPGFLRRPGESGPGVGRPPGEDTIVNMSVWRDVDTLAEYVYRSAHVEIMRRRREWFERMQAAYLVLWWVPRGHRPTVEEGLAKLERLRRDGPTEAAFTLRRPYPAPDGGACGQPSAPWRECPAC